MQAVQARRIEVGDAGLCQLEHRADPFQRPSCRLPALRDRQRITRHEHQARTERERLPEAHPGTHPLRLCAPRHFAEDGGAGAGRRDRQRSAGQCVRAAGGDDEREAWEVHTNHGRIGAAHWSRPWSAHSAASCSAASSGLKLIVSKVCTISP